MKLYLKKNFFFQNKTLTGKTALLYFKEKNSSINAGPNIRSSQRESTPRLFQLSKKCYWAVLPFNWSIFRWKRATSRARRGCDETPGAARRATQHSRRRPAQPPSALGIGSARGACPSPVCYRALPLAPNPLRPPPQPPLHPVARQWRP